MGRPFRRYCFLLAERFGIPLSELQIKLSSTEIAEWMAYDLTKNEQWQQSYSLQKEQDKQRNMTPEEHAAYIKKQLGF